MKFKNAIVRTPCPEMIHGISSSSLGTPDYNLALVQHQDYVETLKACGLDVLILEPDPGFPDSTFIEDVALCTPHCAVITNPGVPSRNLEKSGMDSVLSNYYDRIEIIGSPGTLEAGDVMMAGDHYFIGISSRTNNEGAGQLIRILEKYGLSASKVNLGDILHLKSGISYLENDTVLVSGEFKDHPGFSGFRRIVVDPLEQYAANSLWINGTVLVPTGFPATEFKIRDAGYTTALVDVSEFQKLDGGLSCLSLRF